MTSLILKICLAGTLSKVFPNYGDAFLNGAQMALNQSGRNRTDVVLERHLFDQNPLAAAEEFDRMIASGCHIVVGYDFTNDLMLVRKKSLAAKMLIISTYGASNTELDATPNIRTLQVPPKVLARRLINFVGDDLKRNLKEVLLVTTIDWDELVDYRNEAIRLLEAKKTRIHQINLVETTFSLTEVEGFFAKSKARLDAVILFVRSRPAAKIADFLAEKFPDSIRPLILGTKFFGTATLPAFTNMLVNKKVSSYFTHQTSNSDPDARYQEFIKAYREKYKEEPMGLSGLAYDAVSIAIAANDMGPSGAASTDITSQRNHLLTAAGKVTYRGISGIRVEKGLKFSYTKSFVVRTDENGYHLVE